MATPVKWHMRGGIAAVERADAIAKQADIVAALTLEVLKGTSKAFTSGTPPAGPTDSISTVCRQDEIPLH